MNTIRYKKQIAVKGTPDKRKKRCFDCLHCQLSSTWKCTSPSAIERRNTSIPGEKACLDWEPVLELKNLSFKDKVKVSLSNSYVKIDLK